VCAVIESRGGETCDSNENVLLFGVIRETGDRILKEFSFLLKTHVATTIVNRTWLTVFIGL
jgi:hypothetical protein